MVNRLETLSREPVAREKCRHYWVIESPQGPISRGVCKLCGAEKEFLNYVPDLRWEKDISTLTDLSELGKTLNVEPGAEEKDSS